MEPALSDPFHRLERPVIGGHLHGLPGTVLRLQARSERPVIEARTVVGEPRRQNDAGTRRPQRVARAEPNAPQLIRVVKTPYGLHPTWARRKRFREARDKLVRFAREPAIALALEALERPAFSSPAQRRPRAMYPKVPRGLAARYASESPGVGEAE